MSASADDAWREGGCHCGAVRFRIRVRDRKLLECNCTMCATKEFLGIIVTPDDFELLAGGFAGIDILPFDGQNWEASVDSMG